jgi:hypothetical protein
MRVRAGRTVANSLRQDGSALDIFAGVVADIAGQGPIVAIRIDLQRRIAGRPHSVERLGLAPGAAAFALKSVALDRRRLSGPIQRQCSADAKARDD